MRVNFDNVDAKITIFTGILKHMLVFRRKFPEHFAEICFQKVDQFNVLSGNCETMPQVGSRGGRNGSRLAQQPTALSASFAENSRVSRGPPARREVRSSARAGTCAWSTEKEFADAEALSSPNWQIINVRKSCQNCLKCLANVGLFSSV